MMRLIDRLFRRSGDGTSADATSADALGIPTTTECPHTTLTARWDSVEDMGKEGKASSFTCTACNQSFSPDETAELRATESERLRRDLG